MFGNFFFRAELYWLLLYNRSHSNNSEKYDFISDTLKNCFNSIRVVQSNYWKFLKMRSENVVDCWVQWEIYLIILSSLKLSAEKPLIKQPFGSFMCFMCFMFYVLPPVPCPLCLKLVRSMLETWNWYVGTHTYVVSENIPFSTRNLLILLISAFLLQKMSIFY